VGPKRWCSRLTRSKGGGHGRIRRRQAPSTAPAAPRPSQQPATTASSSAAPSSQQPPDCCEDCEERGVPLKACSACRSAWYCGGECQQAVSLSPRQPSPCPACMACMASFKCYCPAWIDVGHCIRSHLHVVAQLLHGRHGRGTRPSAAPRWPSWPRTGVTGRRTL
jgi:hypothetical protein